MKRSITACITLGLLTAISVPVLGQGTGGETTQDRLERIRQRAAAARSAARNQPPPPTATVAPPPPTVAPPPPTVAPPPPPTQTTPPPPQPQPTAQPTASATAAASASAAAEDAGVVPPKPKSVVGVVLVSIDELRRTRPDRRRAEVDGLRLRWGQLLLDERAKSELRLHATRIAYLQRIRSVADKANDTKFVEKVDALITKEERRNADAMNAFRSSAPAPAPGAAQ